MAVNNLEKFFPREFVRNDGLTLNIYQASIGDVGCVVWDAALVLAKYLESSDFLHGRLLQDKTVLELGAGTGCLGIIAATFGAKVCISDLESCLPLMQMNITENEEQINGQIEAKILDWNDSHDDTMTHLRPFDYILISDCIYYSDSVKPLVDTINRLSEANTTVLCSYEERTSGNKPELQRHFYELIEKTFNVQEIPQNHQDDFYHSSDIHIMKFTKKS